MANVVIRDYSDKFIADLKKDLLEESSKHVEKMAKNYAPVKSGALKRSIDRNVGSNEATVGSDLDYAIFVEMGTRKMAPRAFLRRALSTLQSFLRSYKFRG